LLKGKEVEFKLENIDPPVGSGALLLVNEDLRHMYIFDPGNNRVVIFDTVGNLNRQIHLGEESQARDVAVDVDEKELYVLDGSKVLVISLVE